MREFQILKQNQYGPCLIKVHTIEALLYCNTSGYHFLAKPIVTIPRPQYSAATLTVNIFLTPILQNPLGKYPWSHTVTLPQHAWNVLLTSILLTTAKPIVTISMAAMLCRNMCRKFFTPILRTYNSKAHCDDTHGHNTLVQHKQCIFLTPILITASKPTVTTSTCSRNSLPQYTYVASVAYSSNITYGIAFTAGILLIAEVTCVQ